MNWFWLSIIALLCWSGSDLFSKIGCREKNERNSHLKMVVAVGVVMFLHAMYEIFIGGVPITLKIVWTYLPVSCLYILSMALGYIGLRYIELSISSPICNSSGALVALLCIFAGSLMDESLAGLPLVMALCAVVLVCSGVIGLGVVEAKEDEVLRARRQEASNYKYAKSVLALCLPIAYCVFDAAGTFADVLVLRKISEDSANVAYELTFFVAGIACLIYLLIRKEKFTLRLERPKYIGALFETAGQLAYIYALADESHAAFSAPIISSYCVVSVVWSRLFLKEKLSLRHYAMILLVIAGIIILGILDL